MKNLDKEDQGESRIDLTNLMLGTRSNASPVSYEKESISRMFEMLWSNLEIIVC